MTPSELVELRNRVGVCLVPNPGVDMPSCHETPGLCCCDVIRLLDEIDRMRAALEIIPKRICVPCAIQGEGYECYCAQVKDEIATEALGR